MLLLFLWGLEYWLLDGIPSMRGGSLRVRLFLGMGRRDGD